MKSFLHAVVSDLYDKLDGNFDKLTVVFPNKRASLFFNQELAELADRPIWIPKYTTISELFASMSNRIVVDQVLLICYLYKTFVDVTGRSDETLDRFYSWGEMMLSDFDDIDNNMARADLLFRNIEDLEELTDFSFLTDEQKEAIRRYFVNFNPDKDTKLKEKFLSIWNTLSPVYEKFKSDIAERNYAYTGMMKREVVEALKRGDDIGNRLSDEYYAIVGFNVLNETEKELFRYLKKNRTAFFYWDYDNAYTVPSISGENRITNEAGRFILDNIRIFGSEFSSENPCLNAFNSKKNITFVASPTDNAQTRYVASWTENVIKETTEPLNETAIILCNESLLQPVLHSIPHSLKLDGKSKDVVMNVTMGYPLSETPICSYINLLLDLHKSGVAGNGVWRSLQTMRVLKHPYTHRIASEAANMIIKDMMKRNILYPTTSYLSENEFVKSLFFEEKSNGALLENLSSIVESIGLSYGRQKVGESADQLYVESIYNVHSILNRLKTIQETGLLNVTSDTLTRLIRQMISGKTIPFHGEPAIGLQVMGLLETRNLDFKNILMLSVNDDQLPGSVRRSSFIPYSLREVHGMTTMEKQISLYAYYFYRLIQRAENVTLVYNNNTSDGAGKGEMSRFMTQLLVESDKLMPCGNKIDLISLTSQNISGDVHYLHANKTPEVMEILNRKFDVSTMDVSSDNSERNKMLSPSALNSYINCPLQFYFMYVASMRPPKDLTEDIGNDIFGNIFHKAMEIIYRGYKDKSETITRCELEKLAKDTRYIETVVDDAFREEFFKSESDKDLRYNGQQLINKSVIMRYVKGQLKADAELCPLKIVDLEKAYYIDLDIISNGKPFKVRIGGIIDRIDRASIDGQSRLRIVDYKTAANAQTTKDLESLFDSSNDKRPYHLTQLFYYSTVMSEILHEPISPSLCYPKLHAKGDTPPIVKVGKETVYDFMDYKSDYQKLLQEKIEEIFNSEIPFRQSESEHYCTFCDFRNVCGKVKTT